MSNSTGPKIRRTSRWRHQASRTVNRLTGGRLRRHAAAREPRIVHRQLICPPWPTSMTGFRIAHLSDFHLGELLDVDQAITVVRRLEQAVGEVDLVAVTGDIIDFHVDEAQPLLTALGAYPSKHGTWGVLGNHDRLVDTPTLLDQCHQGHVRMLINERQEIDINAKASLTISGIDWARKSSDLSNLVQQTCRSESTNKKKSAHILLSHHPNAFESASTVGVDLVLSGHTHGGQINLKHPSPRYKSDRQPIGLGSFGGRYNWGVYQRQTCRLHVTSGAGSWFPFRVQCPSEVVLLTIDSASRIVKG